MSWLFLLLFFDIDLNLRFLSIVIRLRCGNCVNSIYSLDVTDVHARYTIARTHAHIFLYLDFLYPRLFAPIDYPYSTLHLDQANISPSVHMWTPALLFFRLVTTNCHLLPFCFCVSQQHSQSPRLCCFPPLFFGTTLRQTSFHHQ